MVFGRKIHWGRLTRWVFIFCQMPILACVAYAFHEHRRARYYLAGWAVAAMVMLLVLAVRALKRQAIATGPSVGATVRFTRVREDRYSLWERYVLAINYKYYLKDEPYWGWAARRFLTEPEAEAAAAGWRDREVTIHYNPRHPDRSLLA
jgi:hypothetical protein